MLIFAMALFIAFLLVSFVMFKKGAKQNAQKEQERQKLLGDLGFEAKKEFSSDIQGIFRGSLN